MNNAQAFRNQLIKQRKLLTSAEIKQLSSKIFSNLCTSDFFQQATHIAYYLPVSGEADPTALQKDAGKCLYLPVLIKNEAGKMSFVKVDEHTNYATNQFGIPEPIYSDEDRISVNQLDLVLMPLVGFDQQGNRIGMGGGYYDRSFAYKQKQPQSRPVLVGYAYAFQQTKGLQPEVWDVPMDAVVTEEEFCLFKR